MSELHQEEGTMVKLKRIVYKVDGRVFQVVLSERDYESVTFVRVERHFQSVCIDPLQTFGQLCFL